MTKFVLLSDTHTEFGSYDFSIYEGHENDILLLGGDIMGIGSESSAKALGRFLEDASEKFKQVLYILGNHEYYYNSFKLVPTIVRDIITQRGLSNVRLLDRETYEVPGEQIAVIGCTFWTSYALPEDRKDLAIYYAQNGMNDFRLIQTSQKDYEDLGFPFDWTLVTDHEKRLEFFERNLTVQETIDVHERDFEYIFKQLRKYKDKGFKTVVMTHHAPSYQSVTPEFIGSPLNPAFVSDWDHIIEKEGPDIFCHGHVHSHHDYMIGNTRILCNPRGYVGYEDMNEFDPYFGFEL